jgi:hypothetical protein
MAYAAFIPGHSGGTAAASTAFRSPEKGPLVNLFITLAWGFVKKKEHIGIF